MDDEAAFERLPDPSDMATLREGQFLAAAVENSRHSKPVVATGFCLNCEDEVADGVRWCSKDCTDDWERIQRMNKINGR